MRLDLMIITCAHGDIGLIGAQVVDDLRTILARLGPFDPILIPVVGLGAEEDADDDDRKIDTHGKPVLLCDMVAEATEHAQVPPRTHIRVPEPAYRGNEKRRSDYAPRLPPRTIE